MRVNPSCRYVMLVCQLPPLPSHPSAVKQTPLSRHQLNRRLTFLDPEDARVLAYIEAIVDWHCTTLTTTDQDFTLLAQKTLMNLKRSVLREWLTWRLELRTLVGALRRRFQGVPAPTTNEVWGFGPCVDYIRRYWDRPDFNLSHSHPWIVAAEQHLRLGQHLALEHLLINTVWDHHTRLSWNHHFDFEAVLLYVLRWNLIDSMTGHQPVAARQRFKILLLEGLGRYADPATLTLPIGATKGSLP